MVKVILAVSLAFSVLAGCSSSAVEGGLTCRPGPPCPTGWYHYVDSICSPPGPDGGPDCGPNGDGLCYQPCTSPADCTDHRTPNCTALTVFNGSDVGQSKMVCTSTGTIPACTSADAGHGG